MKENEEVVMSVFEVQATFRMRVIFLSNRSLVLLVNCIPQAAECAG